jgi:hypothetical protein
MEILQQCRFGEIWFQDVAGTMDTGPPADKVQQVMRVEPQTSVGQATYVLAIQIPINPAHLPAGAVFDDAHRTA